MTPPISLAGEMGGRDDRKDKRLMGLSLLDKVIINLLSYFAAVS